MFKKKFKVRVSHFSRDKYTVDYCHYYFLPLFWRSLKFFFYQNYTSGTHCWSTSLWDVKEAEEVALSLKSIDDVKAYHKTSQEAETQFYKERKEALKFEVPYKTKIIK